MQLPPGDKAPEVGRGEVGVRLHAASPLCARRPLRQVCEHQEVLGSQRAASRIRADSSIKAACFPTCCSPPQTSLNRRDAHAQASRGEQLRNEAPKRDAVRTHLLVRRRTGGAPIVAKCKAQGHRPGASHVTTTLSRGPSRQRWRMRAAWAEESSEARTPQSAHRRVSHRGPRVAGGNRDRCRSGSVQSLCQPRGESKHAPRAATMFNYEAACRHDPHVCHRGRTRAREQNVRCQQALTRMHRTRDDHIARMPGIPCGVEPSVCLVPGAYSPQVAPPLGPRKKASPDFGAHPLDPLRQVYYA